MEVRQKLILALGERMRRFVPQLNRAQLRVLNRPSDP